MMILNVILEGQTYPVQVPPVVLEEGEEFFRVLDRDMDRGWQMSRTWVEKPDVEQRCQIVADKLLTALHTENQQMLALAAGYILTRMAGVTEVRLATDGDMLEHELVMGS
ncbi:MAG: hypothetical protein WCC36_11000 [Gammaproteobacteria bacterium]